MLSSGRLKAKNFGSNEAWELQDLLEKSQISTNAICSMQDGGAGRKSFIYADNARGSMPDGTLPNIFVDQHDPEQDDFYDDFSESISWTKRVKLILPHIGLILLTITYTVIGASIFYSVERPNEDRTKANSLADIEASREELLDILWEISQSGLLKAKEEFRREGIDHLHNLTDLLFTSFQKHHLTSSEIRYNDTKEIWNFRSAVFFACTVVTTIGYGNPVPVTFYGRTLCIFFALFGIPLTLVTVADIGKFLSEHLLWLYCRYRILKRAISRKYDKFRGKQTTEIDTDSLCELCRQHDSITDQMEQKIPTLLVLTILISYTALGGLLMYITENWNFFDAFYFSFITMTTVGFGDLIPLKDEDIYAVLVYIVLGLAVTTMCIDIVGVQYIKKIHYFGHKIRHAGTALSFVGGKAYYVHELLRSAHRRNAAFTRAETVTIIQDGYVIRGYYAGRGFPFIPKDIRRIRYIDETSESIHSSSFTMDGVGERPCKCKHCHIPLSYANAYAAEYL